MSDVIGRVKARLAGLKDRKAELEPVLGTMPIWDQYIAALRVIIRLVDDDAPDGPNLTSRQRQAMCQIIAEELGLDG